MTSSGALPTVFLDAKTMRVEQLDLSALEHYAHPLRMYATTSEDQLMAHTDGAMCVITNKVKLGREFFEARPSVRLVCIIATGTNNVDLLAAKEHGVTVVNCRGYSTQSVAQHTIMLMLMLLRSIQSYQSQIINGSWNQSDIFCLLNSPIGEAEGLTLGIVGYGNIGKTVETLAQAFGMRVLVSERMGNTPRPGRHALEKVIEKADIVTLHCPLTSDTRHLINAERLGRMKRAALLINTARGELIDEESLVGALRSGKIGGAALDVLSKEPPPDNHPLLSSKLPNLVLTPHNAWASFQARQRAVDQTAENIASWKKGGSVRAVV